MNRNGIGQQPYLFEWVAAPPPLEPYLNSLYILRCGNAPVEDMLPAYSGQMVVVLRGGGEIRFADGGEAETTTAFFLCPLSQAQAFTLLPNTVMLGVSLNFRGWAAITGLPVDENSDCVREVGDLLGADAAASMGELVAKVDSGRLDEPAALDQVSGIVAGHVTPLSERHSQVIDRTIEWLSSSLKPGIGDLLEALPYSERQAQRLVARFFGQPPVRLIRRYRAIRAATILAMPEISPELQAEVRGAFYDQAHMIKELRHFTGRTPRALGPDEQSVAKEMLAEPGYGSVDLFGGNQGSEPPAE